MSSSSSPETVRPPVALGCFFAVAVIVVFVGVLMFGVVFLESGADTGEVQLELEEAYGRGSVQFVAEENIYLVRLFDGSFAALSDLDAANRANQGRRCRVLAVAVEEPGLPAGPSALRADMTAAAAGASTVLRETCFGSVYDIAGAKLLESGPNLRRFLVNLDNTGRVVIDTSKPQCSVRTETLDFAETSC